MIIPVLCPTCGSSALQDTDNGTIYPEEIQQEFQCEACLTIFNVTYEPIAVKVVQTFP